jgi:hypothetical protein
MFILPKEEELIRKRKVVVVVETSQRRRSCRNKHLWNMKDEIKLKMR